MRQVKPLYILSFLLLLIVSCNQTRYVPENKYLIKKNKLKIVGDKDHKEDLTSIIRQPSNYRRFWIKWKLNAYNSIDSVKVAEKRTRLDKELRIENEERIAKQNEINQRRIDRAREKGRSHYTHKTIRLKDTINPRKFLREWYKYQIGEAPVIFDSVAFDKTLEQMNAYLNKKGYYYGEAAGAVFNKDNKKCKVKYVVTTGERYFINSTKVECKNPEVKEAYDVYVATRHDPPLIGQPFDNELLDSYRYKVAKYMRDSSFYGFSANHITYVADTHRRDMTVDLTIQFGDRTILVDAAKDSMAVVPHRKFEIQEVFFHISDTMLYEGNFRHMMDSLGLSIFNGPFLATRDTLIYSRGRGDDAQEVVFYYNERPFVKPRVLEQQNLLEKGGRYSERSAEASYSALLRMNLFKAIKTDLKEIPGTNRMEVHYYIAPKKRQSYSFQPRATNMNGYLGVSATVSYTNRNLFRGGEQLTLSVSGGFESQPPVFEETQDGKKKIVERSFNTFEVGPSLKYTLPGLFPFRKSQIWKRRRPQTIMSTAYNYHIREDFERRSFQMNYQWKFILTKTSLFEIGLPAVSVVKFINIKKTPAFEQRLQALGDLFLLNAYSNQFIWQDWRIRYEYNIKEKTNRKGNSQVYFHSLFDPAGNVLSAFQKFQDTVDGGQYSFAHVGYSQFLRLDNELIFSKPLGKERSANVKVLAGGGLPYGNTKTSMPYDYSFFGGGANDNRGWYARTLGPGGYKYYLDTLRSTTQIGDIRLAAFGEFRFAINSFFKGAVFVDAGNVWTMREDPNRVGGNFSSDWWRQIAVSTGVGLRMDLDYFIIRLDMGIPIRNPALPAGENWFFQDKTNFELEADAAFGTNWSDYIPSLYAPRFHFGIGYPF